MLKRTIGCLALGGASILGSLVACGSPDPSANAGATTSATVALELYDGNGLKVGSCGGTMISPDTVLTAAHCVAGKHWWKVTVPSTGQVAHSSAAYAYDWKDFHSTMSHPMHNDLAILKIDTAIHLAQYPTIATTPLADGAAAMRVRASSSSGFEAVAVRAFDGTNKGFPNYYYTSMEANETLTTGTALIDPTTNQIYGVMSGRGLTSGFLYVSRTETIANWLGQKASCNAAIKTTTSAQSAPVSVECHPVKPPPPCDGGASSSSSSGGSSGSGSGSSSSGGSSSGASSSSSGGGSGSGSGGSSSSSSSSGGSSGSGSSSGGSSSGTTGSSGSGGSSGSSSGGASSGGNGSTGDGGSCSGGGGYCYGSGCDGGGNGSGGGGGSSSGGNGSTGSSGSSSGGHNGSGSGGSSSGGTSSGGNGTSSSSGSGGSSGSSSGGGYNGGSSGGTSSGGNGTTGPGAGGNGGDTGGDGPGCTDSTCGGCAAGDTSCSDNGEDFGDSGNTGVRPPEPLY